MAHTAEQASADAPVRVDGLAERRHPRQQNEQDDATRKNVGRHPIMRLSSQYLRGGCARGHADTGIWHGDDPFGECILTCACIGKRRLGEQCMGTHPGADTRILKTSTQLMTDEGTRRNQKSEKKKKQKLKRKNQDRKKKNLRSHVAVGATERVELRRRIVLDRQAKVGDFQLKLRKRQQNIVRFQITCRPKQRTKPHTQSNHTPPPSQHRTNNQNGDPLTIHDEMEDKYMEEAWVKVAYDDKFFARDTNANHQSFVESRTTQFLCGCGMYVAFE